MASKGKAESLEQTPTWAVAVVCFVLVAISIVIEHLIHVVEKVFSCLH
jgi:mlo protein